MKVLEVEGKLVRAKSDMSEFTVRFERDLKYFKNERVLEQASLFYENDWLLLKIKDMAIVVDWVNDEPKAALEVTFAISQKIELELSPIVLFQLDEGDEERGIFEVVA